MNETARGDMDMMDGGVYYVYTSETNDLHQTLTELCGPLLHKDDPIVWLF